MKNKFNFFLFALEMQAEYQQVSQDRYEIKIKSDKLGTFSYLISKQDLETFLDKNLFNKKMENIYENKDFKNVFYRLSRIYHVYKMRNE